MTDSRQPQVTGQSQPLTNLPYIDTGTLVNDPIALVNDPNALVGNPTVSIPTLRVGTDSNAPSVTIQQRR
jgi:hypothetical protein